MHLPSLSSGAAAKHGHQGRRDVGEEEGAGAEKREEAEAESREKSLEGKQEGQKS